MVVRKAYQEFMFYCPVGTVGPAGTTGSVGVEEITSSTIDPDDVPAPAIIARPIDVAKKQAAKIAVARDIKFAVPLAVMNPL